MWSIFRAIRADERRDAWAAFFVLFGLIGSHAILETARDALFRSKVPASRLPYVYIGIAAASLGITRLQARFGRGLNRRNALVVWTLAAGAVTAGFFFLIEPLGDAGLYALYIWSGLLTSLVLIHFWVLLGDTFSVTQAKRLYGMIGAGSVIGAIAGTAAASALADFVAPRTLVAIS